MKTKIAVMFGGKSVEHEVSVISAIQAIGNMNREKYDILPVYISKTNEMYIGDGVGDIEQYKHIDQLIAKSQRVILISSGGKPCLLPYPLLEIHRCSGCPDSRIRISDVGGRADQ